MPSSREVAGRLGRGGGGGRETEHDSGQCHTVKRKNQAVGLGERAGCSGDTLYPNLLRPQLQGDWLPGPLSLVTPDGFVFLVVRSFSEEKYSKIAQLAC